MRQAVLVAPKHIEFKEVSAPKARFTLTTDSIPLRSTP